jgi:ketosteroid isomerase-like protein
MSQENVERLRDLYSKLARGQFRGTEDVLAADVVFEPMSDGRDAYFGREAVARQLREFLAQWDDYRIEAQEFVEVGDAVVVTERQSGTGKRSGIEAETTFFAAWVFRDGQVVRARWESDRASAFEAARRLQGSRATGSG